MVSRAFDSLPIVLSADLFLGACATKSPAWQGDGLAPDVERVQVHGLSSAGQIPFGGGPPVYEIRLGRRDLQCIGDG